MTVGGPEGGRETQTATELGTQESGAGELHREVRASGCDTRKAPSTVADEAGAQARHGEKPAQRGQKGGPQENKAGKTSGVQGNNRGRDASGVAH